MRTFFGEDTVNLYQELCCDECNDVIHNHFDCPACDTIFAGTNMYHQIDSDDKEFSCENCKAVFNIIKINGNAITIEQQL